MTVLVSAGDVLDDSLLSFRALLESLFKYNHINLLQNREKLVHCVGIVSGCAREMGILPLSYRRTNGGGLICHRYSYVSIAESGAKMSMLSHSICTVITVSGQTQDHVLGVFWNKVFK